MHSDDSTDMSTHFEDRDRALLADETEAIRESEEQIKQRLVLPLEEAIARVRREVDI